MQEKDEKYIALYKTQDRILEIVAKENLGLYLTGGTALQRFHFDSYRYSDDLDFFLLNNGDSNANTKEFSAFAQSLKDNAIDFKITTQSPYFMQIIINENNLKVDLVNDVVFHEDDFVKLDNGLLIDSIQNIFANKLETSISRNEARDLFDIYTMLKYTSVSVCKGFELLGKKTNIIPNDVINNIKQIELTKMAIFKNVAFKNNAIRDDFVANFKDLIEKRLTLETNLQKFTTIAHKPNPHKNRTNDNGGMEL